MTAPLYVRSAYVGAALEITVYTDNENVFDRFGLIFTDPGVNPDVTEKLDIFTVTKIPDEMMSGPAQSTGRAVHSSDFIEIYEDGDLRHGGYFGKAWSVGDYNQGRVVVSFPMIEHYQPDFPAINVFRPIIESLLIGAGRVSLHASSAAINGKAVIMSGFRGSGKSTLLDKLLLSGGDFLADDRTMLGNKNGEIIVETFPEHLRRSHSVLEPKTRIRPDLTIEGADPGALFLLMRDESIPPSVRKISPSEAAAQLMLGLPVHYEHAHFELAADMIMQLCIQSQSYILSGWGDSEESKNLVLEVMDSL